MLAITGLGATTSLGTGVVGNCAALRCGIARPGEVTWIDAGAPEGAEPTPLIVHATRGLADGFEGLGRWVRLADAALSDLRSHSGRSTEELADSAILFAVPLQDVERYRWEVGELQEAPSRTAEFTGLHRADTTRAVLTSGHTGIARGLTVAAELLESGECNKVILVGVDSYVDTLSLRWLEQSRRFKTGDFPVGLMPGEAAGALLLEPADEARAAGRMIHALVGPPGLHYDTAPEIGTADLQQSGPLLGETIATTLEAMHWGDLPIGTHATDLNGENWRAQQLGVALSNLQAEYDPGSWNQVVPALSFGETGAASGALGICAVARAFARDYAGGTRAIVTSSADSGDVACVPVEAPD